MVLDNLENLSVKKLSVFLSSNPCISMIWGDVGVGKTTLALQLSKIILTNKRKVFYLKSKLTPFNELFSRILTENWNSGTSDFVLFQNSSLNQQTQKVLDWNLHIPKLNTLLAQNKVGLIVIDEISNHYLLEMSTDKTNKKLNRMLTTQLATLANICESFKIPVLLLNTFSIKSIGDELEHNSNFGKDKKAVPHGGGIIDYWVKFALKISRTTQPSRMKFTVTKNMDNSNLISNWSWILNDSGFN